ncbi:hypothetical protein [Sagittula sp. S175]|uniref:VpaChn25_0724 family phage protein n=1 Tax=Sagittula sp. S175 TaxID=3415129 RepID=UPI003C7B7144
MSEYAKELREHARLAILIMLEDAPNYTTNASMITDLLVKVGIPYSRAQVITELHWLKDNHFITLENPMRDLWVATATVEGCEIATGRARHPDIQRPRPRS